MKYLHLRNSPATLAAAALLATLGTVAVAQSPATIDSGGQGRGRGTDGGCTTEQRDVSVDCGLKLRRPDTRTAKERAPIDLTGFYGSVITEDWRFRMMVPPKGDFHSLPLNLEGERVANMWDPKDVNSCKVYGAAALMRNPLRAKIEWVDDNTLKLETDHGQQTRVFHFGAPPADLGPPSLQGYSTASWDMSGLKVVTTNLTPGYLRSNGVPYSDQTRVTEYYNLYTAFDQTWMTVTTLVDDPVYLTRQFATSLDFKKLRDGSAWKPTPCGAGIPVSTLTHNE
jgi:hypothetical protein